MDTKRTSCLLGVACLILSGASAQAVQIDFTGGNVFLHGGGPPVTTNNSVNWGDVDYYEEDGFTLDFIGTGGLAPFESNIGDYYGVGNDVIHGHWATGDYGGLTQIKVTKIGGASFDLNYFVLTSNTDTGGAAASGFEQVRIHASLDGTTSSFSQLLPAEDWGFPGTQIFLGPSFDGIKAFWFTADNAVDCFGMDSFFIDEPAPPEIPEPGSLTLLGIGLAGLGAVRRRRKS
jgi:hypothetical protein